ncbi:MAG: RAD55 family ATPase [Candidatus Heimdallarchaeota archaeon]
MTKLKTGIKGFDAIVGGIESGSRTILYGPNGTGKTVFAMQFLWQGLQNGETVSFDVMDKPFPRLRWYFKSFGWDIEPYEEQKKFIGIQAFQHFHDYPSDPRVIYFSLDDFEEMKRIDKILSEHKVTRFAAGDFSEHLFGLYNLIENQTVENWTVNWSYYDNIANLDICTAASSADFNVIRARELAFKTANNLPIFRINEKTGKIRRELRIVKMEGEYHPLDWIPFEITKEGILFLD